MSRAASPRLPVCFLQVRLPLDLVKMVDDYVAETGISRVKMVELALLRYLSEERFGDD